MSVRRTWPARSSCPATRTASWCAPAVAHLEAVFASDWYMETGQRLDVIADVPEADDIATQLLPSGPPIPTATHAMRWRR